MHTLQLADAAGAAKRKILTLGVATARPSQTLLLGRARGAHRPHHTSRR